MEPCALVKSTVPGAMSQTVLSSYETEYTDEPCAFGFDTGLSRVIFI